MNTKREVRNGKTARTPFSRASRRGGAGLVLAGFVFIGFTAALSAGAQTVAITGGKVFPVSGAPSPNGTVLIKDGKIVAVGAAADVKVPSEAQRIDATGKWVTPGLFNAGTQLGLFEIGFSGPPGDVSASGKDGIAASYQAANSLNPASVYIAPARKEGVTTVGTWPQGGMIAGQGVVWDMVSGSTPEMIVRQSAGVFAQIDYAGGGTSARGEMLGLLRDLFDDTRAYAQRKNDYERAQTRPFLARRSDLEALIPVVEGRQLLVVNADKASHIQDALKLAADYKLRIAIAGGGEAWEVADELAAAKVPVLTGAMNNIPGSFYTLGARQENAGLLRKAGVSVVLIGNAGGGDEEMFNVRNIKYEAGNAVAYGMSWDDALRAITLTPAEVFGVSDRIGSLQAGREGNVVVWSGDPFEFGTRVEHVLVRGKEYTDTTRQDLLVQRYRKLPPAR